MEPISTLSEVVESIAEKIKIRRKKNADVKAATRARNKLNGVKEKLYPRKKLSERSEDEAARLRAMQKVRGERRKTLKNAVFIVPVLSNPQVAPSAVGSVLPHDVDPLPEIIVSTKAPSVIELSDDDDDEKVEAFELPAGADRPQPANGSCRNKSRKASAMSQSRCRQSVALRRTEKLGTIPPREWTTKLQNAMSSRKGKEYVHDTDRTLMAHDFDSLLPGVYVNDAIINAYVSILRDRAAAMFDTTCHISRTYFFTQLTNRDASQEDGYNFQTVATWHDNCFGKFTLY